jgi:IS1 family transposase
MLDADVKVLEMIEENMVAFRKDIERDVTFYRQHVTMLLNQMTQRCDAFLESNITIFKPQLLSDPVQFQQEFQREVLMDVAKPIDDLVLEMSNLLSQRARTQSRSVMDYVGSRPRKHAGSMIGSIQHNDGQFDTSRLELIEKLRRDVKSVLTTHDHTKHIESMSSSVRTSLLQTAALQTASVATVGGMLAAHLLDITGILAASGAAALGFFLIPRRKAALR